MHNYLTISQAAAAMQQGNVIAYPTEAVWGLGCDPMNQTAVEKILQLKNRPWQKGLIVIAANWAQLSGYCQPISKSDLAVLNSSWNEARPNTWLIPAADHTPIWLKGEHQTLAVRVSQHPLVQDLCQLFGGAIVSTSANPASEPPAMTAEACRAYFGDQLPVMQGTLGTASKPSQIRDLRTQQLVRD